MTIIAAFLALAVSVTYIGHYLLVQVSHRRSLVSKLWLWASLVLLIGALLLIGYELADPCGAYPHDLINPQYRGQTGCKEGI